MEFADLGLSPDTLKAVTDAGYLNPTPIQEQAIPVILMGRDVLGVAQTGTGKTAAFTMPMIDILSGGRAKARMPRSLIIAPTRELAAQISENFIKYGKYHPLAMALLIGGESFTDQEKALDRGVDVLIATPGRLLDLYERGRILLNDVKLLVIDEADRMLDMGFIPDVERIVSLLPKIRQTLFFSATMDKEIRKLADTFLMNPKEVAVSRPAQAATTIEQGIVTVRFDDKREALRRILRAKDIHNAFIFCNRKKDVDILFKSLTKHGFNAVAMHGDMPQSKRNEMLAKFKANEAELLVCSDVAARGLDISAVGFVVNFDVPVNAEDYVHRIGRTGRAGLSGHAYTIATRSDSKQVAAIQKMLNQTIPPLVIDELNELTGAAANGDDSEDQNSRGRRGGRGERDRGRGGRTRRGGRGERKERGGEDRAPQAAPEENVSVAAEAAIEPATVAEGVAESAPDTTAGATTPPPQDQARQSRRERERSWRRDRNDYNRDARAPEERARKTRRNPHGIAEMDHGDNVVAFGGFTPAFLLIEPYVAKPSARGEKADDAVEDQVDDEADAPEELEKSA